MAILPDRTELTTPADGDLYVTTDVSDTTDAVTGTDKKITWANVKAGLKTYFDTLYAGVLGADDNYVTDAEKVVIGNTSGTNSGDNAVNSNYSGLVSNATHTGDVTGSTALTIANGAVTLAKMANVDSATVFYRKTISAGAPEVQTFATLKTDLGLTGTNSGDQTSIVGITGTKAEFDTAVTDGNFLYVGDVTSNATHTGDVTGATTLTIADGAVSLAKMANLAQDQFIGRTTASTGVPQTATITSAARTVLDDTTVSDMVNTLGGATATGTGGLVRLAGPTLTGTTTLDRLDYDRAVGLVNAIGNLGATETIDWSTHTHYTGTLDSNITFTYSNQVSGQVVTLYLSYDATAQRTITWPTTTWLDNATGAAPTAPAASGNILVVTLSYVGTTTFASATGNYAVYA